MEKLGIPGGKDSSPGKAVPPGAWRLPLSPAWPTRAGLKLELNAEANPGSTGEEEGIPAAAWRGATVATEEEAPGSPIKEDSTGLPAAVGLDPPKPGKAGFGPGGRPVNTEGAVVNPRPKGEDVGVLE